MLAVRSPISARSGGRRRAVAASARGRGITTASAARGSGITTASSARGRGITAAASARGRGVTAAPARRSRPTAVPAASVGTRGSRPLRDDGFAKLQRRALIASWRRGTPAQASPRGSALRARREAIPTRRRGLGARSGERSVAVHPALWGRARLRIESLPSPLVGRNGGRLNGLGGCSRSAGRGRAGHVHRGWPGLAAGSRSGRLRVRTVS